MYISMKKTMKAFACIFRINSFSLIRPFCSNQRLFSSFTQAIFNDQIHSIKWSSMTKQQRHKFNFSLSLQSQADLNNESEWTEKADMQSLSTNLQFVWNMSHKYQRMLVGNNVYLNMLIQYYRKIEAIKQNAHLNHFINSNIPIKYLCPHFIYTDHPFILSILKEKQKQLLHTLFKSRTITISEFIQIFAPNIYNITDWPLICQYFYKHFYPIFDQLHSLKETQRVFQYLSKFNQISSLLIDRFFTITSKQLQSDILSLDSFLSICNCMGMILFSAKDTKLHQLIQRRAFNKLYQLSSTILMKEVQFQTKKFSAQSLLRLQTIDQLIKLIHQKVTTNVDAYLKKHYQQQQIVPQLIKGIKKRQAEFVQRNQHTIIESIKMSLVPKLIRGNLVGSYFYHNTLVNQNCQIFNQFISKYPCYPNLIKQVVLTYQSFIFFPRQKAKLPPSIEAAKNRIDQFVNVSIKNESRQTIVAKFFSKKQLFHHYGGNDLLWNMRGQQLLAKCMLTNDYSFSNLLGMLKNDNNFLISRFESKFKEHMKNFVKQTNMEVKFDYWDYPLYFKLSSPLPGYKFKTASQDDLILTYSLFYPRKFSHFSNRSLDSARIFNQVGRGRN